jgi:hypothetical protein
MTGTQVDTPRTSVRAWPQSSSTVSLPHWFDELCKQLVADGKVSRRNLLRGILAGWVATGSGVLGVARALGQPLAPPTPRPPPPPGPCTIAVQGGQQVIRFSTQTTFAGKPLVFTQTTSKALGVRTSTTATRKIISLGGTNIIEFHVQRTAGGALIRPATTFLVNYGQGFTGVKQGSFTIDGKVLHGEFDGRAIVPFTLGSDPTTLKFADGKAPPNATVDPAIQAAINAILAKAKQDAVLCNPTRTSLAAIEAPTEPDPPDTGRSDDTNSTPGCISRVAGCVAGGTTCDVGVAVGCAGTLFFYAVCLAAGLVTCETAQAICIVTAHDTGAPCCPVGCGDTACCFGGDTCLDPNRGVCCASGSSPCNGRQCCQPTDRCLPDGTCCPQSQAICANNVCCQPGQACSTENICCEQFQPNVPPVSCRGTCCAADEVCKDGVACCPPNDPVCNGTCCRGGACDNTGNCCPPPSHVCGGICCAPFNACCGTTCCDVDSVCLTEGRTGQPLGCCPRNQTCGLGGENPVCCPAGQMCTDQQASICAPCPAGQVACLSINVNGPPTSICCPQGVSCCNGKCCNPQEICCRNIYGSPYGVLACHSESLCIG